MRFSCQNWSLCPTTKWNLSPSRGTELCFYSHFEEVRREIVWASITWYCWNFLFHISWLFYLVNCCSWMSQRLSQLTGWACGQDGPQHFEKTSRNVLDDHICRRKQIRGGCKLCAIWPFLLHFSCLCYTDTVRWLVCCLIWTKIYSGVHPGKKKNTVQSMKRPQGIFRTVSASHSTSVLENPDIICSSVPVSCVLKVTDVSLLAGRRGDIVDSLKSLSRRCPLDLHRDPWAWEQLNRVQSFFFFYFDWFESKRGTENRRQ